MNIDRRLIYVVATVLVMGAWMRSSTAVARADVLAGEKEKAVQAADSIQRESNARIDSAEHAVDSLRAILDRAEVERDSIREVRHREQRAAAAQVTQAIQTGDSLLDQASIELAQERIDRAAVNRLLEAVKVERDVERDGFRAQIAALNGELRDERTLWLRERLAFEEAIERHEAALESSQAVTARLRTALEFADRESNALRDARGLGFWNQAKWTAIGAGIGFVGGVIVR